MVLISGSVWFAYRARDTGVTLATPDLGDEEAAVVAGGVDEAPGAPELSSVTPAPVGGGSAEPNQQDGDGARGEVSSDGFVATESGPGATIEATGTVMPTTTTPDSSGGSTSEAPTTTEPVPTPTTGAQTTTEAPPTTEAPTTTEPIPVPTISRPTTTTSTVPPGLIGRNLITNGGFELPELGRWAFTVVDGWTGPPGGLEIWVDGHEAVAPNGGRQFLELNGLGPEKASQTVAVVPGGRYRWSFAHRGRKTEETVNILVDGAVVGSVTTGPGRWMIVSGEHVVPAGRERLTFGLQAVDPGTIGNFVDDVRFELVGSG
ncbi:MAG: hypothetical protein AAF547_03650 [Actinomycetota bacterium]